MITLVITTCKRYDLFLKIYASFQKHILDKHLISDIIIMDNCSDEKDRVAMQKVIPEAKMVFFDEPGYHHVMEYMFKNINTPYLFLLQDDWECFRKGNWLTVCKEIIDESNIECVCLQPFPTEDFKSTTNGYKYIIHQTDKEGDHIKKRWPGFSFNPSMWCTAPFKKIDYPQDPKRHEWKFANRCKKAGYNVAYIDRRVFAHLGKVSAYDLNGINRKT